MQEQINKEDILKIIYFLEQEIKESINIIAKINAHSISTSIKISEIEEYIKSCNDKIAQLKEEGAKK